MKRVVLLATLVLLSACHRRAADFTPDADADAQAATAAKTLADIAAADAAAKQPMPAQVEPVRPPRESTPDRPRAEPVSAEAGLADSVSTTPEGNDQAPR